MTSGAQDHRKVFYLEKSFNYTDKVLTYEVAPWTVIYNASPADRAEGAFGSILGDIKGRAIVAIASLPSPLGSVSVSNWPTDYPDSAVLAALQARLPAALDTGALKVREQNPLTTLAVTATDLDIRNLTTALDEITTIPKTGSTWPVSSTQLPATLDGANLKVHEQGTVTVDTELPAAGALDDASANPTTPLVGCCLIGWDATAGKWRRVGVTTATANLLIRALTNSDVVSAEVTKWGGTALTGRDTTKDLANLNWQNFFERATQDGNARGRAVSCNNVTVGAYFCARIVNPNGSGVYAIFPYIGSQLYNGGVSWLKLMTGVILGGDTGDWRDILNPKSGGAVTTALTMTKSQTVSADTWYYSSLGVGANFKVIETGIPTILGPNTDMTIYVANLSAATAHAYINFQWAEVSALPT